MIVMRGWPFAHTCGLLDLLITAWQSHDIGQLAAGFRSAFFHCADMAETPPPAIACL
jgi:hypothetical protein